MRHHFLLISFLNLILFTGWGQSLPIRFDEQQDDPEADPAFINVKVFVGESLFTIFRYTPQMEKPVLFPVYGPNGSVITRGFPLEPRPGERVDHPHHLGMWFNYGSINGIDFWNNSPAIPAVEKNKYGTVQFQNFLTLKGGKKDGVMEYEAEWLDANSWGHVMERTKMNFSGTKNIRRINRMTTLTTGSIMDSVFIGDNKEGMLAIRMDRAFEEPVTQPEIFTDAQGKPSEVPVMNNEGVNGEYRNSNGARGSAVWGKRANWVALTAVKDGKKITIAMIDHPSNFGYPAHWHARGYGLFSVNNFGSKVYVPTDPDQSFVLRVGDKIILRHRIIIGEADTMTDKFLDKEFREFSLSSGN